MAFVPQTARRHAPAELATFARPIPASPPSGAWNVPRNLCDVRPDTWLGQSWGEYGNIWKHMETYGTIWKHMETYGNILDNWDRTLDSFSQSFWGLLFTGLRQIFPENQFTKPDITSMIWSYMALLLRDEASKNKQGIWWTYYKRRTSNGKCLGMYGTVWSCHLWGVLWVCCPILWR